LVRTVSDYDHTLEDICTPKFGYQRFKAFIPETLPYLLNGKPYVLAGMTVCFPGIIYIETGRGMHSMYSMYIDFSTLLPEG
jgi:hypothetical protein